jgi:hypothetical protein
VARPPQRLLAKGTTLLVPTCQYTNEPIVLKQMGFRVVHPPQEKNKVQRGKAAQPRTCVQVVKQPEKNCEINQFSQEHPFQDASISK